MSESINDIDVLRNKYHTTDFFFNDKSLDIRICTKVFEDISKQD